MGGGRKDRGAGNGEREGDSERARGSGARSEPRSRQLPAVRRAHGAGKRNPCERAGSRYREEKRQRLTRDRDAGQGRESRGIEMMFALARRISRRWEGTGHRARGTPTPFIVLRAMKNGSRATPHNQTDAETSGGGSLRTISWNLQNNPAAGWGRGERESSTSISARRKRDAAKRNCRLSCTPP